MLMLMLVLVSCIAAVVNSQGSSSERNILKQRFKQGCSAAIENEPDLDASEVDAYTEYVEQFDKLDRYLNDGCNFTRNYRAYQRNKRRIDELNANAPPAEVVNGRVFKQSYAVNEFADCDDDCRKEYLEEINTDPNGVHRRLGEGDNMAECIQLDPNHFADGNADATVQDSMWSEDSACGAVKDQGVDGACWAFAATAQFQCNFNVAHQEKRVFSEKYATDCSDEQSVSAGGVLGYLDEWYTENGACSDYYKAWDKHDATDYDGDCDCESEKAYGQCYTFSPSVDSAGKLAIANAAQLYALSFAIDLCRSFYDLAGDNAVWYGCRPDEERLSGHAMTIVGQEVGRYVLVRNSWGNGTGKSVPWGSRAEPGHVWFHSDVWTSDVSHGGAARFYFNYFPPQAQSEHEAPTAKCHEQGPCDSGFMDTSDGLYTDGTSDEAEGGRCPLDCEGGAFVDSTCNCVCQAAGMCDSVRGLGAIGGDENGCPLVSSGFGYSDFNGEWAYAGEFNEKAYYQHDQHADFFVAYSGSGYYKYVITADMRGGSAYCNCHANELTECEWYCWDGVHESATALVYVRDEEGVCAQPTGEEGEEEEEEGEDWACPLVSSGFSYDWGWFDGNWTYLGDYEGKPYYQHKYYTYYFLLYSDYLEDYMITWDITSWESYEVGDASYCRCGAVKLSKCEWKCWDEIEASATFLTNCDSSSHSNVKEEEKEEEEEEEEEEGECPLVSSGFSYTWGWFNGDWTYLGDYDGKPSYQHNTNTYYFLLYSDYLEDYMITYDITRYESYQVGDASYCRCGAVELSKCEWTCWGDIQVAAKILTNCDSSSSSHSNVKTHQIKLVKPSGVELIAITTNEALAVVVALLICVNVCVAMELMRRRAGAWCRKTSYAKVQMVDEDSEAVMQSEAEQILQVSN